LYIIRGVALLKETRKTHLSKESGDWLKM